MDNYTVTDLHRDLCVNAPRILRYREDVDIESQKIKMEEKFRELLGIPEVQTEAKPVVEFTDRTNSEYDEIRFTFETEPGYFVPAHMLLPKSFKGKLKIVICLQGHSTGMHISLARPKFEGDEATIAGDRDFAVQAVRRGYTAIAMEQRCFGELEGAIEGGGRCHNPSMQALLLGRTTIGERAFDVGQLINALGSFPELDTDNIALMGNSGGGTATFYTSCVEKRITAAMPSCAFCSVKASIFAMHHCQCNYIPGYLKYFEMGDLALLIAPRPLIIVCGKDDPIFPLHGVREGYETVEKIYKRMGASDKLALVVGDGGHRFYAEQGWHELSLRF
ncbi:MAG: hypothetical protein GX633_03510 [Clostridiales bacterium]|nr:hypothetical protein [Clostridiales bacterium]